MLHPAFSAFSAVRLTFVSPLAALAVCLGAPALAQHRDVRVPVGTSHEVVQPLPPAGITKLDDALKRLAADPRDGSALLQAGDAALELEDVDAAIGFYTRAQALGGAGGEAKAGLAAAQVYKKMPVEALRLFAEAERAGVPRTAHASDHGLAYDLVGDNAHAQEYYRLALQQHPDDKTTRRLALSQAIGGDQTGSERTLLPLLQGRDLAAYRTRAFALAAGGKADEAVSIAEAVMPDSLAGRIAPYLRYMPKLSRAQQAAAGNFGHFPEAGDIGRDDPRIAAYAAQAKIAAAPPTVSDRRLVPAGAPLGRARPAATVAGKQARRPASTTPAPEVASLSTPAATPVAPQEARPVPRPSLAVAISQPAPAGAAPARTGLDSDEAPANRTGAIAVGEVENAPARPARTTPATATEQVDEVSLEKAFAAFENVKTSARPAAGAVDVTAIKPAREAPPKPKHVKPVKPKDPSRIWVQVATGSNRKALGSDWRRITRKAAKDFKGKDGYLVDWGRTNRLVTGPFASEDKAQDFVTQLKKAGISTFMFTSDDGEEVVPLPGK